MRQLRLGEGSFAQQSGNMTLSEVSPLSSGRCAAGVDEKSRMTFRDFAQNRGHDIYRDTTSGYGNQWEGRTTPTSFYSPVKHSQSRGSP